MSQDINKLYHNDFGVAFIWNQEAEKTKTPKIQIIFRDMGFYLTYNEIIQFRKQVHIVKQSNPCFKCKQQDYSRNMLLKTPSKQVDLAINSAELQEIDDLINGTLFHFHLHDYVNELCKN